MNADNTAKFYTDGIKEELEKYWGGWLPTSKLSLGDIGILEKNFFRPFASLKSPEINIDFEENSPSKIDFLECMSKSGVEIAVKAGGQTNDSLPNIPNLKAGINLKFSNQGAFFVQLREANEVSIKNLLSLEDLIIERFKAGYWNKEWVIITKIIKAPTGIFFISKSSNSNIEYEIEGDASFTLQELAKISSKLLLKVQKGNICPFKLTYFFSSASKHPLILNNKKNIFQVPLSIIIQILRVDSFSI